MKKYLETLISMPLFSKIDTNDLENLLNCLGAKKRSYQKGEMIFGEGDKVSNVGIILSGSINIFKDDFFGNRNILSKADYCSIFAEAIVCSGQSCSPVGAIAAEDSEILFIKYEKIVNSCSLHCAFHSKLVRNMLTVLARNNILLTAKFEHIIQRTTREKVLSYLSDQAKIFKKRKFEIPFNRQELADFLSVERSALSAELSKMRNEGILDFQKNLFELL